MNQVDQGAEAPIFQPAAWKDRTKPTVILYQLGGVYFITG